MWRGEGAVEDEKVIGQSSGAAQDMFSIDRVVSKDVGVASPWIFFPLARRKATSEGWWCRGAGYLPNI